METNGGTIGEQLVIMGALTDDALTDFYRSRLLVPQVNPNTLARLPIRVVAAIPSDMAIELRAVPVALDAENNLTVAMSDPSDRHAVDEIMFFTGAYVVRAVATQMQIAWCLAHYYGHVTTLGQRLMQSTGATAVVSPPVARTRGLTGKIEALRHRGVPPITGPVNLVRPQSGEIVTPAEDADSTPKLDVAPRPIVVEPAVDSNGVPAKPRARSVSGEIRAPGRRAPSIRPPVPEPTPGGNDDDDDDDVDDDDESGPVITVEVAQGAGDDDETGPVHTAPAPVRKRKAKSDPPELYARAGEVDIATGPVREIDLEEPRIIIAEEAVEAMTQTELSGELRSNARRDPGAAPSRSIEITEETGAGVVIREQPDHHERESQPILLDRRRPSDQPTNVVGVQRAPSADDGPLEDDVVVLDARKPAPVKHARTAKPTQVGIGALPAQTRPHRDTEAGAIPQMVDDAVTGADTLPNDDTVVTSAAPSAGDTSDETLAAPPSPDDTNSQLAAPPSPDDTKSQLAAPPRPAGRHPITDSELAPPPAPAPARPIEHDDVDDGWGPPGTTIPPPLLGAVPGANDDHGLGRIPVSNVDAAPLIVAAAIPRQAARSGGVQVPVRLEDATSRAIELIRALELTRERNDVVEVMIAHVAETHRRAGFFVIRRDELTVFAIVPRPPMMPFATLRIDRPSTLADVVGTRLPYRGPIPDDASQQFLTTVLGVCPPEILLVPVAVRERVVGVLFGENRSHHTFDDQLAFASRAAGMALERILKAKRS